MLLYYTWSVVHTTVLDYNYSKVWHCPYIVKYNIFLSCIMLRLITLDDIYI